MLIDKWDVFEKMTGFHEEPLATIMDKLMSSIDRLPVAKPVSQYTRPKFVKGVGWTLYGRPVELFYRRRGSAQPGVV